MVPLRDTKASVLIPGHLTKYSGIMPEGGRTGVVARLLPRSRTDSDDSRSQAQAVARECRPPPKHRPHLHWLHAAPHAAVMPGPCFLIVDTFVSSSLFVVLAALPQPSRSLHRGGESTWLHPQSEEVAQWLRPAQEE